MVLKQLRQVEGLKPISPFRCGTHRRDTNGTELSVLLATFDQKYPIKIIFAMYVSEFCYVGSNLRRCPGFTFNAEPAATNYVAPNPTKISSFAIWPYFSKGLHGLSFPIVAFCSCCCFGCHFHTSHSSDSGLSENNSMRLALG